MAESELYTTEEREDILRTLISVSVDVEEADGYVTDYSEDYRYPNKSDKTEEEIIIDKYNFVRKIFGIGERLAVPSEHRTIEEIVYKALLSTLIIQKPWE